MKKMNRREFTATTLTGCVAVFLGGLRILNKKPRYKLLSTINCSVELDEFTGDYEVTPLNDDIWRFEFQDLNRKTDDKVEESGIWHVNSCMPQVRYTTLKYKTQIKQEEVITRYLNFSNSKDKLI